MIRALFLLIVGTLFLSSLTTPLVYEVLTSFFEPFPWPFSRVYDRVAMLWAAILLLILRKEFSLGDLLQRLKSGSLRKNTLIVSAGILATLLPSLLLIPSYVDGVVFLWKEDPIRYALAKVIKVIPAALLISLIEEGFFRVIFFEKCKKHLPLFFAVVATSVLYAFVHFIAPVKSWQYPGYSALIGFEYLLAVAERMQAPGVFPAAIGLFLVGMVLCVVIQKTKSLYLCIGMHAGWVMAIKVAGAMTIVPEGYIFQMGAGRRYFLVSEPLSWAMVFGVAVLVLSIHRMMNKEEAQSV